MQNNGYLNTILQAAIKETNGKILEANLATFERKESACSTSSSVSKEPKNSVTKILESPHIPVKNIKAENPSDEESKNGVLTPTKQVNLDFLSESDATPPDMEEMTSKSKRKRIRNRKDVVYKTALRSLRRFYIKLFKTEFPRPFHKSCHRPTIAAQVEIVKGFWNKLFPENRNIENITHFMLSMINHKLFDSSVRVGLIPPVIKQQADDLFGCFYSFKMGKFRDVARLKWVKHLFKKMFSYGLTDIIRQEKVMSKNPELYEQAFAEIVQIE